MNNELIVNIENIINVVLTKIIKNEKDLKIEFQNDENLLKITIFANKDDRGQIIGKRGSMIKSIRTIVRAIASRNKIKTEVIVFEENK